MRKVFCYVCSRLGLCKATDKVCVKSLPIGRAGRVGIIPKLIRLSLK